MAATRAMDNILNHHGSAEGHDSSIGSGCSEQPSSWYNDDEGRAAKRKVHCSYKINPVAKIFSNMQGHKKELLASMGLSGLMKLPIIETPAVKSVNRQLGFWLLLRFNGETGVLELGERGRIPITEQDINLVLGVSCNGDELKLSDPNMIEVTKDRIKDILMIDRADVLDLDSIMKVLERELPEDATHLERNAFVVAAAIYAISYFLAPKGRPTKINTEILEALQDPSNVFRINWASYVLKTLKDCSNKIQREVKSKSKTVTLEGCLLLLQIAYLDNLDFGEYSTTQVIRPRLQAFTKELMDRLTNMDKVHNAVSQECKFGKRQIRDASEIVYSWGAGHIEKLKTINGCNEFNKLLNHIDNCNDQHMKRMRTQHKEFAEQQLKETGDYHEKLRTMIKSWSARVEITIGMLDVKEDYTEGGHFQYEGEVQMGGAPGAQGNQIKIYAAHTSAVPQTSEVRKRGRTKHVAKRKRIEKRKRGDEQSWGAVHHEDGDLS